jgi:hypothetical protein
MKKFNIKNVLILGIIIILGGYLVISVSKNIEGHGGRGGGGIGRGGGGRIGGIGRGGGYHLARGGHFPMHRYNRFNRGYGYGYGLGNYYNYYPTSNPIYVYDNWYYPFYNWLYPYYYW